MRRLRALPDWFWLASGLFLRLAFALKLGNAIYQADEPGFEAPAWSIARSGFFAVDGNVMIKPPLPAVFYAAFYAFFGRHPVVPRLGQAFVGAALAWLIGRFTRDLTGSQKAGKLALILAAIYPFFIYYGGMLLSETFYMLAAVAGLWLLCRVLRDPGAPLREAAGAGFLMSLSGLCRTEGVVLFAVILLFALAAAPGRRLSCAAALLVFALPLAAWSARNHRYNGHWSLDEHGGTTLLHGSVVFEQDQIGTAEAMEALHGMKFWQDGWRMPEDDREKYFTAVAFRYMREDPARTARQWARKFVNFWRFYPRSDHPYKQIAGDNPAAGFQRPLLVAVSLIFEPALILGGLWGLWSLGWRPELAPLWLFLIGTNAAHVISVSQMRYRLAVMPVLMLGLCGLVSRLIEEPVA